MKKILENKKRLVIVGVLLLLVVVIVIILLSGVFKKNVLSEKSLISEVEKLGVDFYENHYYPGLENDIKEKTLSSYMDSGIVVDITNIKVLIDLDSKVQKQLDIDHCDPDETKIFIYPREPFGVKDYQIKVELSCEK